MTPSVASTPEDQAQLEHHKYLEECYAMALRSAADYAFDFDLQTTQELQGHLHALEDKVVTGADVDTLRSIQASFRGELREYREKARLHVQRLRDDLAGAADAMTTFASTFVSTGSDAELHIMGEMKKLEETASGNDLNKIRTSIRHATEEISRSYEDLNKANGLVVAQLQHEIRLLHREIQTERRTAWTDRESGAWIKRKLDDKVEKLLESGDEFCVLVMLVSNLKTLEAQCGKTVVHSALNALVKRCYGTLGDDTMIARLGPSQFAAIIEVDTAAAQLMAREVSERLSSRYSVQNNGIAQNVAVKITCGIVSQPRDGDPEEFHRKFQQMTGIEHQVDDSTDEPSVQKQQA